MDYETHIEKGNGSNFDSWKKCRWQFNRSGRIIKNLTYTMQNWKIFDRSYDKITFHVIKGGIKMGKLNLTLEQTIEEHRKMWNWIADESVKQGKFLSKHDYLYANEKDIISPVNKCFLCDYLLNTYTMKCEGCIANWRGEQGPFSCESIGSPYHIYKNDYCRRGYNVTAVRLENYQKICKEIADSVNSDSIERYKNLIKKGEM